MFETLMAILIFISGMLVAWNVIVQPTWVETTFIATVTIIAKYTSAISKYIGNKIKQLYRYIVNKIQKK